MTKVRLGMASLACFVSCTIGDQAIARPLADEPAGATSSVSIAISVSVRPRVGSATLMRPAARRGEVRLGASGDGNLCLASNLPRVSYAILRKGEGDSVSEHVGLRPSPAGGASCMLSGSHGPVVALPLPPFSESGLPLTLLIAPD